MYRYMDSFPRMITYFFTGDVNEPRRNHREGNKKSDYVNEYV